MGFEKKHSTSMAIFELVEEIKTAMDNSMSTVAVFIDLKKAFDTVHHNILLNKLEHYGIRGLAFSWIQSYLTNRTQSVSINDTNSTCINVTCGVPQGSILGLNSNTLYSLYTTLIIPYMNYCCEFWGNNYKSRIQPLYMLQQNAIRICKHGGYLSHTRPIFTISTLCVFMI